MFSSLALNLLRNRKSALIVSIVFSISAVIAGCSIRKTPTAPQAFPINTGQLSCLERAGTQLGNYLHGSSSESEVTQVWNCMSAVFEEFRTKTHGAIPGAYTGKELQAFLTKYFIHELPLTDDLVAQMGVLKQVLTGGDASQLTLDEIHRFQDVFQVFQQQSLNLLPYMPILRRDQDDHWFGIGGKTWREMDSAYLDGFDAALLAAAHELASALQYSGFSYSFQQLDQFSGAFLAALPKTDDYQTTRDAFTYLHEHIDLLRKAKSTLVNPSGDLLTQGNDWDVLLTTLARWSSLGIRIKWYNDPDRKAFADEQIWQGPGLAQFHKIAGTGLSLLQEVLHRHAGGLIPFDELEALVNVMPADALPFTPKSINVSLRPIIRRLIGGTDPGPDGRSAAGLTPGVLSKLDSDFQNWYEAQHFTEILYLRLEKQFNDSPSVEYSRETLFKSSVAAKLWNEVYNQTDQSWNPMTKVAARRMEGLIRAIRPIFFGESAEMGFTRNDEGMKYSFHDLSELNWLQMVSRLMVRGYVENDSRDDASGIPVRGLVDYEEAGGDSRLGLGVNASEFQNFYKDFTPLASEIHFIDPRYPESAFNRFRQGDAFTYVSDGNGYLDLNETTTLLAYSVSAQRKAMRIHNDIASACKHIDHGDYDGEALITDYDCYKKRFFGEAFIYWTSMDQLLQYYTSLDPQTQTVFQQLLEADGRRNGYQPGAAWSSDDTEGMVGALQYIEAILTRFDTNNIGGMDRDAATHAFPIFKGLIQQFAKSMNPPRVLTDSQTESVLTFMLAKGSVPQGAWDIIWWDVQRLIPILGDFKADRIKILKIFGALSTVSTQSSQPGPSSQPSPTPPIPMPSPSVNALGGSDSGYSYR